MKGNKSTIFDSDSVYCNLGSKIKAKEKPYIGLIQENLIEFLVQFTLYMLS